jgi:hypothetical protein
LPAFLEAEEARQAENMRAHARQYLAPIFRLLNNECWFRILTVQEYVLARSAMLRCGDEMLDILSLERFGIRVFG